MTLVNVHFCHANHIIWRWSIKFLIEIKFVSWSRAPMKLPARRNHEFWFLCNNSVLKVFTRRNSSRKLTLWITHTTKHTLQTVYRQEDVEWFQISHRYFPPACLLTALEFNNTDESGKVQAIQSLVRWAGLSCMYPREPQLPCQVNKGYEKVRNWSRVPFYWKIYWRKKTNSTSFSKLKSDDAG